MQQLPDWNDEDVPGDDAPPEAQGFGEDKPETIERDEGNVDAELKGTSTHPSGPLEAANGSVSGLAGPHRIVARGLVMQAAFMGLRHAPALHYTQDLRRWEGIAQNLKSWRGQYPHYADCSSFATWCIWMGLSHYRVRDTVNGQAWRAGWTGTMVRHGKRVVHRKNVMRGDLALYGDPVGRSGHVAVCIGGGMVISHGSEGGPYLLSIDYRNDLRQIRRYI